MCTASAAPWAVQGALRPAAGRRLQPPRLLGQAAQFGRQRRQQARAVLHVSAHEADGLIAEFDAQSPMCSQDLVCARGYAGPLCGSCENDFAFHSLT